MKLDKKQLPQLIVLGVLVVGCVGYLSFSVFRPKAAPPRPAPTEQAQQPTATAGPEVQVQTDEPERPVVAMGVFPELASAVPRRDPFTPQIAAQCPESGQRPAVRTTRPTGVANLVGNVPPINPFAGSGAGGTPVVAVTEPEPEFVLTGVIRGAENVAIIRVGDKGRHVVREGQLIDGRYKVLRVTDDSAVLVYKNRRIQVRLGGAKNAS